MSNQSEHKQFTIKDHFIRQCNGPCLASLSVATLIEEPHQHNIAI